MTETTDLLLGCKQCGKPLARKSRGPAPTYCSAVCRARAKDHRDKASGKYEDYKVGLRAKTAAAREANASPCPYCGDPMAHPRRVQCGKPDCRRQWTNERMRQWQQEHKAKTGQWYGSTFTYERTCIQCSTTWNTTYAKAKYCTNACQAEYEHGVGRIPKKGRKAYLRRQRLLRRIAKAAAGTRGSLPYVSGPCASCGVQVTTHRADIRWCSQKCKRRQKAARRRALERGAYVEDVSPQRIFGRDSWQCRLCHKPVDRDQVVPHPHAPVLDHIIPLAKGGTHEAANVQCAHFLCNSYKRDTMPDQQLTVVG